MHDHAIVPWQFQPRWAHIARFRERGYRVTGQTPPPAAHTFSK